MTSQNIFFVTGIGISLIVSLAGCNTTELTVKRYIETTEPVTGVVYYLPKSVFNINAKYQITSCPLSGGLTKQPEKAASIKGFSANVSANLIHKIRANRNNAYVIDYQTLQSAMKSYDFEVKRHPNGMLQSINTGAKDKTGDVILSVASTAATLALVNSAGPAGLIALAPTIGPEEEALEGQMVDLKGLTIPSELCNNDTVNALNAFPSAEKAMKAALKKAEKQKEKVIILRKEIVDAGGNLTNHQVLTKELKQLRKDFDTYLTAKDKHTAIWKQLTIEHSFKHSTIKSEDFGAPKRLFDKWMISKSDFLTLMIKNNQNQKERDINQVSESIHEIRTQLIDEAIVLELVFNTEAPTSAPANGPVLAGPTKQTPDAAPVTPPAITPPPETDEIFNGIVYKNGATATAKVCVGQSCEENRYLESKDFTMPDAGPLAILPFSNRAFQSNRFEVEFTDTGALTRVKISSDSTAANQAQVLEQLAEKKLEFETKKASLVKAEADALKEEADALKSDAQAELQAQREEDIANLEYQIQLIEKQKKLEKLSAAPKVNEELESLKHALTIEKLRSDMRILSAQDAESELRRIQAEREIDSLLSQ
ncbi:MAG: hypothetical protein JAZ11_10155 [Candidatus Thiodiazotropha lotti]|nr:hypothetical protein [Candidatus Thiodiazotropha lotti]